MTDPCEMIQIIDAYQEAPDKALALVSLVKKTGSSYRQPGARMLVRRDGTTVGSISGGCLESDVANLAQKMEQEGRNYELKEIDTRPIFGCQGSITLFVERIPVQRDCYDEWMRNVRQRLSKREGFSLITRFCGTDGLGTEFYEANEVVRGQCDEQVFVQHLGLQKRLFCIGAHEDVESVLAIAKTMHWQCTQVVPGAQRSGWISSDAQVNVLRADAKQLVSLVEPDAATAVVIMTHNLGRDLSYTAALLKLPFAYIGMLGSMSRRQELSNHLMEFDDEALILALDSLHCPIGLDIGSETKEEIALSILSEVRAVFSKREGGSLKKSNFPIHSKF
jgi:xanthine dehydrogenase accessory factor